MPSFYPGRHMPLPRLEPSTSEKRWVSVANWATPAGSIKKMFSSSKYNISFIFIEYEFASCLCIVGLYLMLDNCYI
ncbi:hypothetical protein Hanom_Chr16g01509461 [Helianthus anomalus]